MLLKKSNIRICNSQFADPFSACVSTRCKHGFKRARASLSDPSCRDSYKTPAAAGAIVLGLLIVFPVLGLTAQSHHLPAAPTNLVAHSDMNAPGRVWLSWKSPLYPGGARAISHHEYRYRQSWSSRNWRDWTEIPFSASGQLHANQFAAGGLTNGVPFDFQVRAVNSDEAGLPSGIAVAEAGTHFGICGRTRAVRDAIVREVSHAHDCAGLTESNLPGITGSLTVRNAPATLMMGDLAGLTSLSTLDLDGNPLGKLPAGIFDDLTSLTRLILSNNRLTGLPSGVFDELTALQVLNLDGNQLSGLPALEALDLRTNRLSALPDGILSGLMNLRALYLEGNSADPIVLAVSLELDEHDRVRALVPAGAPFDMVLTLSATLREPPHLRVMDAETQEGTDARLDFVVTLEHATLHALSVDYTTHGRSTP